MLYNSSSNSSSSGVPCSIHVDSHNSKRSRFSRSLLIGSRSWRVMIHGSSTPRSHRHIHWQHQQIILVHQHKNTNDRTNLTIIPPNRDDSQRQCMPTWHDSHGYSVYPLTNYFVVQLYAQTQQIKPVAIYRRHYYCVAYTFTISSALWR